MSNDSQVTEAAPAFSVNGIPVTAEAGIDIKEALAASPFTDWLASVDSTRFDVRSIHFQSIDKFGPRVGFAKFKCDVYDRQGRFLPGIIFARGGSVAVLAVIACEGVEYAVLTVQPRLAAGKFEFEEVCAGMLDGSGNFAGVAAKELKEELGMELSAEELIDLTALSGQPDGIFLSPGASAETMTFFYFKREVPRQELEEINGRCTGELHEGEQITLKVVKLDTLARSADCKSRLAYWMYRSLSRD